MLARAMAQHARGSPREYEAYKGAASEVAKRLRAAELGADGKPTIVLLDEWDKTRPVADGLLLAALEERLVVDSTGHVHGRFGSNVIFWITSNASRPLADALVRRCLRIVLPYLGLFCESSEGV